MAFSALRTATDKAALGRRRRPHRMARVLVVVVASMGAMSLVGADSAAASGSFVQLANSARSAHGVKTLSTSSDLTSVALQQAQRMAKQGVLAHNPRLASDISHWQKLGENVGYGPDVQSIQDAFMNSAGHRANILDRDFTQVGVGVVVKDGVVWVSEVFRQTDGTIASSNTPTKHHTKTKPPAKPAVKSSSPTPSRIASHSASPTHSTPKATPIPTVKPTPAKPKVTPTPTVSATVSPPTVVAPTPSESASSVFAVDAAQGPTDLGSTKPVDSSGGGSSLPAVGTIGLIAVLGLALSLRVRSSP